MNSIPKTGLLFLPPVINKITLRAIKITLRAIKILRNEKTTEEDGEVPQRPAG